MEKMDFVIEWAHEEEDLTTYVQYPKVIEWCNRYYPNIITTKDERKAIANLRYYFSKLVDKGVLCEPVAIGLGYDAKIKFFGTTTQYFWRVKRRHPNNYSLW